MKGTVEFETKTTTSTESGRRSYGEFPGLLNDHLARRAFINFVFLAIIQTILRLYTIDGVETNIGMQFSLQRRVPSARATSPSPPPFPPSSAVCEQRASTSRRLAQGH